MTVEKRFDVTGLMRYVPGSRQAILAATGTR